MTFCSAEPIGGEGSPLRPMGVHMAFAFPLLLNTIIIVIDA